MTGEIVSVGLYGNMTVTFPAFLNEPLGPTTRAVLLDAQLGEVDLADITDVSIADGVLSAQQVLRRNHPEGAYDGTHAIQRRTGSYAVVRAVQTDRAKFVAYNMGWNMSDLDWFEEGEFTAITDEGKEFTVVTAVLPANQTLSRPLSTHDPVRHLTDVDDARRRARIVGEENGFHAT